MRPGRQGRMRPCPRRCMHRLAERRMRRSVGSRMRDPEIPFQALRTLDSRKVQPGGPGKRLIHAFSESSFEGFESHIPFSSVQQQSTRWLVVQKHRGRYATMGLGWWDVRALIIRMGICTDWSLLARDG
jgi:hypothetical protein